jgi:hypothetical protein
MCLDAGHLVIETHTRARPRKPPSSKGGELKFHKMRNTTSLQGGETTSIAGEIRALTPHLRPLLQKGTPIPSPRLEGAELPASSVAKFQTSQPPESTYRQLIEELPLEPGRGSPCAAACLKPRSPYTGEPRPKAVPPRSQRRRCAAIARSKGPKVFT